MTKKPKKSAVDWGQRPLARAQAPAGSAPGAEDNFVQGAKGGTVRLNFNLPRLLHARIKSQCALQGRNMTEVIMEMLETQFPPQKGV